VPDWYTGEYKANVKHGYYNLKEVPECVISYFGYDLLRGSWIAGMPIPRGISEMDVSGLTELPSKEVKPCGIAECPVNIEARVISSHKVGSRWMHYICEIVGVSVNLKYGREDREVYDGLGVLAIDPWFEVKIGRGYTEDTDSLRFYYNRMDLDKIERCPEDIGCYSDWDGHLIGTFEQWLEDEQKRGKLAEQEKRELFELNAKWQKNKNTKTNGSVKRELTLRLKRLVSKK
jgi:hypothetical protein